MKKVYRFNLIPGVEFVEDDGLYFTMADDPVWPKSHITKVVIEGLIEYEKNNSTLYDRLEFTKKCVENRDKTIEEKDKEIKTNKNTISYLNGHIEYIKKCAENEIDHRNKLLDEKDEEIKRLFRKLREETEEHKEYIKTFTDKINALEATLKKKDETIENLRNSAKFANNICDGYSALTNSLTNTINEKDSEIKVLSDQVTRLMDQLKETMEENPVCGDTKLCCLTPEMIAEYERRTEKETKPENNFDKVMADMHSKLTPARLAEMISKYDCKGVSVMNVRSTQSQNLVIYLFAIYPSGR